MTQNTRKNIVHVAVGVIVQDAEVLLAKRATHQHQGGLWEFPGGKVELAEHVTDALIRELNEELGIAPTQYHPLIQIHHDYGDKTVLLDVWRVSEFDGEPSGREGQPLRWVPLAQLKSYEFPAANKPIVQAATLPTLIAITPSVGSKESIFEFCLHALSLGARGFQIRSPQLSTSEAMWINQELYDFGDFNRTGCIAWMNSCHLFDQKHVPTALGALRGVHLASRHHSRFASLSDNSLSVTASCHSFAELKWAQTEGVNAAFYSPVLPTASHPKIKTLGWRLFAADLSKVTVPVYALGGLTQNDLLLAQGLYAQGIAGISMFEKN